MTARDLRGSERLQSLVDRRKHAGRLGAIPPGLGRNFPVESFGAKWFNTVATLNKRLATFVILFLLLVGLGALSNRFFGFAQFAARPSQNASLRPLSGGAAPFQADKRTFLVAIPNEGDFDLQQLPRGVIGTATPAAGARPPASRVLFEFQNALSSRSPAYILHSALNL
ncbi:MAG TPA: hypothetical protein VNN13_03575 [Methylomirabilota bacterium]|nr:hypothetical protein [Methylomirabilota bacterium]